MHPYEKLLASPWGNELLEKLAERAIDAEKLGQRGVTDLLTVSFSSNDYVGHAVGPDAPEVRDMAFEPTSFSGSSWISRLRKWARANVLFVLSADHGVAPTPEVQHERKMPGDSVFVDLEDLVRSALVKKFGDGNYTLGAVDNSIYLNFKTLEAKKIEPAEAYRVAAEALFAVPQAHVARVLTRDQLEQGVAGDPLAAAVENGFYPARSGDIVVVYEPYYLTPLREPTKATHFSPYNYDTHVPVIFFGAGVRPGWHRETNPGKRYRPHARHAPGCGASQRRVRPRADRDCREPEE